jgi:hypothetical protein
MISGRIGGNSGAAQLIGYRSDRERATVRNVPEEGDSRRVSTAAAEEDGVLRRRRMGIAKGEQRVERRLGLPRTWYLLFNWPSIWIGRSAFAQPMCCCWPGRALSDWPFLFVRKMFCDASPPPLPVNPQINSVINPQSMVE